MAQYRRCTVSRGCAQFCAALLRVALAKVGTRLSLDKDTVLTPRALREQEEAKVLECSYFECPISHEIMEEPVCTVVGSTYERSEIERWLEGRSTDPVTGVELASRILTPNRILRKMISEWKARRLVVSGTSLSSDDPSEAGEGKAGEPVPPRDGRPELFRFTPEYVFRAPGQALEIFISRWQRLYGLYLRDYVAQNRNILLFVAGLSLFHLPWAVVAMILLSLLGIAARLAYEGLQPELHTRYVAPVLTLADRVLERHPGRQGALLFTCGLIVSIVWRIGGIGLAFKLLCASASFNLAYFSARSNAGKKWTDVVVVVVGSSLVILLSYSLVVSIYTIGYYLLVACRFIIVTAYTLLTYIIKPLWYVLYFVLRLPFRLVAFLGSLIGLGGGAAKEAIASGHDAL